VRMHTTILLTVLLGFVSTTIKAGETDDAFSEEQRQAIRELFHLAMDPKSETSSHIEFKNSVFAIIDEYDVLNGQCHMTEYYDRLKGECTACSECADESCFYKCQDNYCGFRCVWHRTYLSCSLHLHPAERDEGAQEEG